MLGPVIKKKQFMSKESMVIKIKKELSKQNTFVKQQRISLNQKMTA